MTNNLIDWYNNHTMLLGILKAVKGKGCYLCKYKFEESYSENKVKWYKWVAEILFHLETTHGLPKKWIMNNGYKNR